MSGAGQDAAFKHGATTALTCESSQRLELRREPTPSFRELVQAFVNSCNLLVSRAVQGNKIHELVGIFSSRLVVSIVKATLKCDQAKCFSSISTLLSRSLGCCIATKLCLFCGGPSTPQSMSPLSKHAIRL